jgi:hypothetical protein
MFYYLCITFHPTSTQVRFLLFFGEIFGHIMMNLVGGVRDHKGVFLPMGLLPDLYNRCIMVYSEDRVPSFRLQRVTDRVGVFVCGVYIISVFNLIFELNCTMSIPEKIPIKRIEDYHTHFVGFCDSNKQFWGYGTFVFDEPYIGIDMSRWQEHKLEYIVLHTFDISGNYLATKHFFAGTTANRIEESDEVVLSEWLSKLGDVEFKDIYIKPFQTVIDGYVFGLIPTLDSDGLELQPSSTIFFHEPWDGEYDT